MPGPEVEPQTFKLEEVEVVVMPLRSYPSFYEAFNGKIEATGEEFMLGQSVTGGGLYFWRQTLTWPSAHAAREQAKVWLNVPPRALADALLSLTDRLAWEPLSDPPLLRTRVGVDERRGG